MARIVRTLAALGITLLIGILLGCCDPYHAVVGGGIATILAIGGCAIAWCRSRASLFEISQDRMPLAQGVARVLVSSGVFLGGAVIGTTALLDTSVHQLFSDSDRTTVLDAFTMMMKDGDYVGASELIRLRMVDRHRGASSGFLRTLAALRVEALVAQASRADAPEAMLLLTDAVAIANRYESDARVPQFLLSAAESGVAFDNRCASLLANGQWADAASMLSGRAAATTNPIARRALAERLYDVQLRWAASFAPASTEAVTHLTAARDVATHFDIDGRVAEARQNEAQALILANDLIRRRISKLRSEQRWADLVSAARLELESSPVPEISLWLVDEMFDGLLQWGRSSSQPSVSRACYEEARALADTHHHDDSAAVLELERLDRAAETSHLTAISARLEPQSLPEGWTAQITRVNMSGYPIIMVDVSLDPPTLEVADALVLIEADFSARINGLSASVTGAVDVITSDPATTSTIVVLALDTSGSMAPHTSSLHTAAIDFLRLADTATTRVKIRLQTFGSNVIDLGNAKWLSPLAAMDVLRTSSLNATGGTALYSALQHAINTAATERDLAGVDADSHVVVFSDGKDSEGTPNMLSEVLSDARARDVSVSCIGLASSDLDWECLKRIARETGGTASSATIEQLGDLFKAATRVLGRRTFRVLIHAGYSAVEPPQKCHLELTIGGGRNALNLHSDFQAIANGYMDGTPHPVPKNMER